MKDWREDYVVCKHVANDEALQSRHAKFRVCCETCFKDDFLTDEHLKIKEVDGLAIGEFETIHDIIESGGANSYLKNN